MTRQNLTRAVAAPVAAVLSYLLAALLLPALLWRIAARPAYRERLHERFGVAPRLTGPVIWLHAVSVGEAQSAVPLVRALRAAYADHTVLVSTTTPTGAAQVRRALGDAVVHAFMPYDLPDVVSRFLRRTRPRLLIVVETELWPNLMRACARRAIPMAMVSARLSVRSARGYRRFQALFRPAADQTLVVGAQTAEDADRFRTLFADRACVQVTGNMKFDLVVDEATVAAGRAWRRGSLPTAARVLLAGSTHDGEEHALLEAFAVLRRRLGATCRLVLVPRHPERFDAVAALVRARGWRLQRRSARPGGAERGLAAPGGTARGSVEDGRAEDDAAARRGGQRAVDAVDAVEEGGNERETGEVDVFLVDTMGELQAFYAACDVAFIGGTLVPVGGHNPLEAAAVGRPVLVGPHTQTAAEMVDLLLSVEAAVRVTDAADLAHAAAVLLDDPARADAMGAAGARAVAGNRGAVRATVALLAPLLAR